jgi:peroxiredoxin Q/BCP
MVLLMSQPAEGDIAPAIEAPSTDGPFRLSDLRGSWVVLYFYPRDFTPGCTTEACDFRDAAPAMHAKVVGVSADPIEQHLKFRDEHGLPFPLISDEANDVARAYGAYGMKKLYGKEVEGSIRSTFIIDPDGVVRKAMRNVKATGHAERVVTALEALRG